MNRGKSLTFGIKNTTPGTELNTLFGKKCPIRDTLVQFVLI
jgi:hypothetical protein